MSASAFPPAVLALAALLAAGCAEGGAEAGPADPARRAGVVERVLGPAPEPVPDGAMAAAARLVRGGVEAESFPGAALAVGNRDLVQLADAWGRTHWDEDAPPADPGATLYDLASLTKVVATTAAVMALVEDRRLLLDAPVRRYLPSFTGGGRDRVTVRQLLTHTSGLRAGVVKVEGETPAQARRYLHSLPLALEPGADVLYSDLGFVVLWEVAERAAGEPLPEYLRRRVWGPLGMASTRVGVPAGCAGCAPTLYLEERDEPYTGGSYDEVGRRLEGLAGNSGAFSTARDLARFAAMIANEGRLGRVRVFERRTVRGFTRPQPGAGTRALGWEVYCREGVVPDRQPCGEVYAFGHTGATGTSIWVDPVGRSWVVLLANRTYLPRGEVDMQALRREVYEAVVFPGQD
ncbi:MAG TPA: serine hydrolase domain-containing protein [Longimicrobiaceae bacterium]|nr:serine hydrolase domain-containing protein [Longimicrobiaceae bacterium]